MRHWIVILFLISGFQLSWSLEIDNADEATVLIATFDKDKNQIGSGSGFFVTSDGHILTNAHVVSDPKIEIIVIFGKGIPSEGVLARKIWVVEERDTAVLKAKKPSHIKPFSLLEGKPAKGEPVWALGYPGKQFENMKMFGEAFDLFDATLSNGIVSRIFEGSEPNSNSVYPMIQHTAEISPGNSGGPLLDECTNVVGINTGVTFAAGEVTDTDFFAIGSDGLLDLLNPRIAGLTVIKRCDANEDPTGNVLTEEPKTEEELKDNDVLVEVKASPSNVDKSIFWLILMFFLLVAAFLYFRSKLSNPSRAELLTAESTGLAGLATGVRSRQVFRMSGFDKQGAPVSFEFGSESKDRGEIIGRTLDFADFKITNADVSRAHAQVKITGKICYIRDLGSTNGTSVNSVTLEPFKYTKISYGDEIAIATCTLSVTT